MSYFQKSEEYEVGPVCEDFSDAQSSCSSNKNEVITSYHLYSIWM